MVPQNTYWFYVGEKPVGMASVRHHLTDALRQAGGTADILLDQTKEVKVDLL